MIKSNYLIYVYSYIIMCNIEMTIFIMRVDEFLCKFTFISKISKEMRLYILVYKVFLC